MRKSAALQVLIERGTKRTCAKSATRGSSLLHDVCHLAAPFGAAKLALDLSPAATLTRGSFGALPLHCAANASPLQVALLLAPCNPGAVPTQGNDGFSALCWACVSCSCLGAAQLLLEREPTLASKKGGNGQLLTHIACGGPEALRLEAIAFLMELCPESLGEAGDGREAPLCAFAPRVGGAQRQGALMWQASVARALTQLIKQCQRLRRQHSPACWQKQGACLHCCMLQVMPLSCHRSALVNIVAPVP